MKRTFTLLFIYLTLSAVQFQVFAQSNESNKTDSKSNANLGSPLLYSPNPNHREIVLKSFELALSMGFIDPSGIPLQEIQDRLEAGAYSEDFEMIPGIIGSHFPSPWDSTRSFDFFGNYPVSKIPYGSYRDTLSGWYRGLNHGYDPIQEFKWPGANSTTVDWATSPLNSYIWNNAVNQYLTGEPDKAYQCLGHILHLLADLSVPSHIKVVNHGMDVVELNSGTFLDPDKLELTIDEYEMALSGGLFIPGKIDIPNILDEFRSTLDSAKNENIPVLTYWNDYLTELAVYTYSHSLVNQFYFPPSQNGGWGAALDENGSIVNPVTYATLPLVEIDNEWFELKIKSTATSTGPILPESKMIELCNALVPKAVEYGAGLLMLYLDKITNVESEQFLPEGFILSQNYPNPFNPSTKISWQVPVACWQTLKIYDVLGNAVATLVNEYKSAGSYEVEWNASDSPSGIYFYQLKTENFTQTKKMILLK